MATAVKELLEGQKGPAFTVKKQKIDKVNEEAARLGLTPGMDILPMLMIDQAQYESFHDGTLFLMMQLQEQLLGITMMRYPKFDFFAMEEEAPARLQTLVMAAKELRTSFSEMFFITERIKHDQIPVDSKLQIAYERSAMRMQRMLANMSDAGKLVRGRMDEMTIVNVKSLFDEVFEKASTLLGEEGPKIIYHGLSEQLVTAASPQKLERAAYNLLSNAIKFTPTEGTIEAWLTQRDSYLQLIIQDDGDGIPDHIWNHLFTRYHRAARVEDYRHGMGLGLLITSCIAMMHGGSLLVQRAPEKGTRVCFTIALQKMPSGKLFTHPLIVDYEGGKDPALLELSDVLPVFAYTY